MLVEKNNLTCNERISYAQLTFKELEVLSYCKIGMSCQEISEHLFVSVETIRTHRKNILKKLGLQGKEAFRKFLITLLAEELLLLHEKSP